MTVFTAFRVHHGYSIPTSPFSRLKMPPRPQFDQPQRSFLAMEFHKRRGTKNFVPGLLADFAVQFPGARVPSRRAISDMHKKFFALGTINNVNSASSPGVAVRRLPQVTKTSTAIFAKAKLGLEPGQLPRIIQNVVVIAL